MEYQSPFDAEQTSQFDNFELQVNSQARGFLKETANWVTFLAIVGFVFVVLGIFSGIFYISMTDTLAQSAGNQMGAGQMTGIFSGMGYSMIIGSLLWIFPLVYMLQFASRTKAAVNENNTDKLTKALGSLKSHFKFVGILTIIAIALWILGIIFSIAFGISQAAGL